MDRKTLTYVLVVIGGALAFSALLLPLSAFEGFTSTQWSALVGFSTLALLSQLAAIEFGTGRQAHSSLAFIPLLGCAIVLPPSATLLTATPVILISELVLRRKALKAAFNVAQVTLAVGLSATVYQAYFSESTLSIPGTLVVVTVFFAVNIALSSVALALFRGQPVLGTFLAVVGPRGANLLYDVLSSPFVMITVAVYSVYQVGGMFLLILPLIMLRHTYAARQKLEHANRDLLHALVKAIETRDPYTSGHSMRVATLATLIAEDLGMSTRRVARVRTAALLHDVGKIDPELSAVLLKPHDLTPEERNLIQTHAIRGADLLRDMGSVDRLIVSAVRHHHERYDGKGYPDGLAGTAIPLEARIIMMSDSIDAMLSDRPYRSALPMTVVKNELTTYRGSQFDPHIVDAVLRHNTLGKAANLVGEWQGSTDHIASYI
jgi:putative nucleotidyltransferase with HDIG domain